MTLSMDTQGGDAEAVYLGRSPVVTAVNNGNSGIVERDGEAFYKIANYHDIPPFFIAVVSGFEHWMFVSSSGGLTCGRRNPDNALFPYYTDDKIHLAGGTTGSATCIRVHKGGKTQLWEPFAQGVSVYAVERNLYKNLAGNKLIFEEINHDLSLVFSYQWTTGERFGFVKTSTLSNFEEEETRVEILDGLRNLLPHGVKRQTQNEQSTLLDAYKQVERVDGVAAAIFSLSSQLTDRAEPCEALRATVAWSTGLDQPCLLLSDTQLNAFCSGRKIEPEHQARGRRSDFFVNATLTLPAGGANTWHIVADVSQSHTMLARLSDDIRSEDIGAVIDADIAAGTDRLIRLVGGADGCQLLSDAVVTARHFSNTLFNIMRGGTFRDGYAFPRRDFLEFVSSWNAPCGDRCKALLDRLDNPATLGAVVAAARESGDADLERLALEYLPLTFSRRHGDPSRPWNQFSIDIKRADGSERLNFQGNWRDIFQNWEALSLSFPEYVESFVAKFVNASTADGYNPYRITRDGFEWEVPEHDNSWSNFGYWGDHQVNYLLRLLEISVRYHPGAICELLDREIFVYADVPYRIRAYADLLRNPRDTVTYNHAAETAITEREARIGADGKLHVTPDGAIHRVSLLEKLLLPALVKLGNLVPGGGIWMNTQRPEWNDANNALVGYGLSMVTLCYLRAYLDRLAAIIDSSTVAQFSISEEVGDFLTALAAVLDANEDLLGRNMEAGQRRAIMDALGAASEAHRESVYAGMSGEKSPVEKQAILGFIDRAARYIDHTISVNRRDDGLFHSYNLLHPVEEGFEIEHLPQMLEGQVAVLNSGYLGPAESLQLLESLRDSELYRADQNSYTLYPDRAQVPFMERNIIPQALVDSHSWIERELQAGRRDLVERDHEGRVHFNSDFRNAADLEQALESRADLKSKDRKAVHAVYEAVFRHRHFVGRSGSMFKYEGLGSIYWHMVSKLLLATAEIIGHAREVEIADAVMRGLLERFDDIKDGLGTHKHPALYGGFPTDPYSHTPGFAGVQQPGMTGQVKEDFITRFMELGLLVEAGRLGFAPVILQREEFVEEAAQWRYSVGGPIDTLQVPADGLAFSVCGVPVVYRLSADKMIHLHLADGSVKQVKGGFLDEETSRAVFCRDGTVSRIEVDVPPSELRQ